MVRIARRSLYPLPDTSRRRKQACRYLGSAAQGISERTQESHLHHNAVGGQVEQLPCRHRQAGSRAFGNACRADKTDRGYHGTAQGGKCPKMGAKNEQYPPQSRRNCLQRDNLCLTHKNYIQTIKEGDTDTNRYGPLMFTISILYSSLCCGKIFNG